jgi:hypothetical protein
MSSDQHFGELDASIVRVVQEEWIAWKTWLHCIGKEQVRQLA